MKTFNLRVLAAEKPFYEGECLSLVVPTLDGLYGILANHSNTISAIVPGMIKITDINSTEIIAAVSEGIVKIEDNTVLLLTDTVELPEEIDKNRAERAAAYAKEALLQKKSLQDYHMAQAKMNRAINRLNVAKYKKSGL